MGFSTGYAILKSQVLFQVQKEGERDCEDALYQLHRLIPVLTRSIQELDEKVNT